MAASSSTQSPPIQNPKTNDDDTCSTVTPDPQAPAGSKTSLGAKSDCNGRPTTDDSVIEAMDEQGPLKTPTEEKHRNQR